MNDGQPCEAAKRRNQPAHYLVGKYKYLGTMLSPPMLLKIFDPTRVPTDWQISEQITSHLRTVATSSGDEQVARWMSRNYGYSFTGTPLGFVYKTKRDELRIGMNKKLIPSLTSGTGTFVAGHELGHLKQKLNDEAEGRHFSFVLFRQEIEASRFALVPLAGADCSLCEKRYQFHVYHWILASEAAFPGAVHLGIFAVLMSSSYAATNHFLFGKASSEE